MKAANVRIVIRGVLPAYALLSMISFASQSAAMGGEDACCMSS